MVDDNDKIILCALLQHFMTRINYQFNLDTLLEDLFPHLIHHYSDKAIKDLKGRLGHLLRLLMERDEFMGNIVLRDKIYYIKTTRTKSFMKSCQKLIIGMKDEMLKEEEKETHPQTKLETFFQ